MESEKVTAVVVEAEEFPELSRQHQVRGVPKTVVASEGGTLDFVGAQPEEVQVDFVLRAGAGAKEG